MFEFLKLLERISDHLPAIKRRLRKMCRLTIRGYFRLRRNNQLHLPAELKSNLESARVLPDGRRLSSHVFGSLPVDHDLIVRQFLLGRYFCPYSRFNSSLLSIFGSERRKLIFPLPIRWRRVLAQRGIEVGSYVNSVLWWSEVLLHWMRGFTRFAQLFASSFRALISGTRWPANYAYFHGITEDMLPVYPGNPLLERHVIHWYSSWTERNPEVTTLAFTSVNEYEANGSRLKIVSVRSELPYLPSYFSLIKFFFWGITSSLLSLGRLLTGRWWDALLLSEGAKAAMIRYNSKARLARECFFMYDWTYRPIWTYLAESMGTRICFFFYSTNSEQFKTRNGYIPLLFDWRPINWPNYLVWDQYQKDFIVHHSRTDSRYYITGPMHLSGKIPFELNAKHQSLAVFDVLPVRLSTYAKLGLSKEYFVAKTCTNFLRDIVEIASEHGFHVYLKSKRKVGKRVKGSYRNLLKTLQTSTNVTVLSEDYPAETLIKQTASSISMPWTSTALMAKFFGKPACYYDSTETLFHDDRGAHGIPVCIGKNELRQFMQSLVSAAGANGTVMGNSIR